MGKSHTSHTQNDQAKSCTEKLTENANATYCTSQLQEHVEKKISHHFPTKAQKFRGQVASSGDAS